MQRNNNNNNENKCEKIPPTCCGEQPQRPAMPPATVRSRPNHNYPPQHQNPRFSLTPQTMNMNLNAGDHAGYKEYREQPQQLAVQQLAAQQLMPQQLTPQQLTPQQSYEPPPLVDVKPYNERYHSQQSLGNASDLQLIDRNTSYHSSQTIPNTSYASIKTENNTQQLTPPSPLTPPRSAGSSGCQQQWNFDQNDQQQRQQQLQQQPSCYSSGSHISTVHCSSKSIQKLTSTVKLSPRNSPCTSPSYSSHAVRSASQDSCIPINSCPSVTGEMPTSYFEKQLQKYTKNTDVCTDGATKINYGTLNSIFLQRLHDIDKNAWGDRDLKLITFQEWVDMLLKINDSFITNMEELEREVSKRLELVQQRVNNQLMKCRRDIDNLIKIIQNLYCNKILDLNGVTFETINTEDILPRNEILNMEGSNMLQYNNDSDIMQRNKLLANIKALALEVADKHDEVRDLKRQIICLEEDIQKAQQKIQLKDDVIKELRNDLKCANGKLSASHHQIPEASLAMPPINFENQTDRTANTQVSDIQTLAFQDENGSQFDSLSHNEQEEQQKIKVLEEELNEFFEISREWNKQKIESQRKRLMDIFQTVEGEKAKAYRKLDYMRRQLIDLECTNVEGITNDCDSGFHSKSENDQDAKILDAVRKRLRKLNDTNMELKKKMQKLEMDNSELTTNLQTEKCFSQRNSETLKQVADLLSSMNAEQFSYTDIYNKTSIEQNPFCEAILGMKKAFQEREDQLLHVVGIRNKQIAELMSNEKNYIEERAAHLSLNDMEDINKTPTLQSTISQPANAAINSTTTAPDSTSTSKAP